MRDIKFRAWDTENDRYFKPTFEAYEGNVEDLNLSISGRLAIRTSSGTKDESLFSGRFLLEQYTGLKDKNGIEIYEGDIILYEGDHKIRISDGEKIKQHYFRKYLIGFKNGCFSSSIIEQENSYFGVIPSEGTSVWHSTWEHLEIIGTVHDTDL